MSLVSSVQVELLEERFENVIPEFYFFFLALQNNPVITMKKQNLVVFMEMFSVLSFQSNYENQTALKLHLMHFKCTSNLIRHVDLTKHLLTGLKSQENR